MISRIFILSPNQCVSEKITLEMKIAYHAAEDTALNAIMNGARKMSSSNAGPATQTSGT